MNIGDRVFKDGKSLISAVIPSGIRNIGDEAFAGCKSLSSINGIALPTSVVEIGKRAFAGCESLDNIIIPNSVKYIGEDAFKDVKHIKYQGPVKGAPWGAKSIN